MRTNRTSSTTGRFRFVATALALGLAASACAGDDGASDSPGAAADGTADTAAGVDAEVPLTRVTVQMQSAPAGSMAFLYHARQAGRYEAAGIDLEILPGQSSQGTVEAVAQGNADIGLASGVAVVLGIANGQDIRSVGHFYGASTFGIFAPIESDDPQDIADAVAGGSVLTIAGGPQNVLFDEFLSRLGIDPGAVTSTNVPITSLVQLYASGEGDGLITIVPFANALVQADRPSASVLFRDVTGVEPPDTAVVVHNDLLDRDPDLIRRFLEVSYTALADQRADPEGTVSAIVDAEPALTEAIAMGQLLGQLPYMCATNSDGDTIGRTSSAHWHETAELFRTAGLIGDLDVEAVYTDQFFDTDDPVSSEVC